MITPINRDAPIRRVIAYDMEWFPGTLELRLIGVHDGREYRTYTEVDAFLNGELIPETAGAWYYAHAGGLADFQFLLERLIERGYQVKIAFSGSSAIIVEVQQGELRWTLVDSYWLLRSPLAKIGEAIGIKKLRDYLCPGTSRTANGWIDGAGCSHPPADDPEKPMCIFYAPMGELRTYNEQDCLILQTAITRFQEEMISMNGELCMTQASSAMKLYRRAYLDRPIRTNAVINSRARESYVGSRVEPFATRCNARGGTPWAYYDINSSFPYAMTFPAPGNMRGGRSRLTDSVSEMFLADVEIEVPEMYLPPVPWRSPRDGRIYFPTGSWRAWLWGIDVRLLESVGGRILKVHRVIDFDEHTTLAAYALDLYEKRLKSTTEFEKMLYKLLLNSLYGKFGESPIKSAAYLNPEDTTGMEMLMPGIYLREEPMEIPHEHVPIATHITSFARRTLYRFDSLCLSIPGGRIAYNDSVSADRCVVVRDPSGRTCVLPVERLWDLHVQDAAERFDGKEEGTLPGWTALCRSLEDGREDFLPLRALIRHRAGKPMHLVSTKEGQTEVTCDHGIMTRDACGELEPTEPGAFVGGRREFVRVRPPVNPHAFDRVDLFDELRHVRLDIGDERLFFTDDGEVIRRCGGFSRPGWAEPTVRRFFDAGTPAMHSLLRAIGAFVAEGSATLSGKLSPVTAMGFEPVVGVRNMFSIAQADEDWLRGVQSDLEDVVPGIHTSIVASGGASVLRSGAVLPAFLFAALCGEGHSRNRRLPGFCLDLAREDFLVLWEKLLEGDGNEHPQGYRTYTTISRELASQLSYLLSVHGFDHAITYRPEKKSWMLRLREGEPRVSRVVRHEVREPRRDEWVYDLSVAGGGTFVDAMGCVLLKNTDSCVTTIRPEQLPMGVIGKKLGQMKHEYDVRDGQFVAAKFYTMDVFDIEKQKDKRIIRAKGFSGITYEDFVGLVEGRPMSIRRMTRVRELIRSGNLTPREEVIEKRLKFGTRPKRSPEASLDGEEGTTTRPWSVSELLDTTWAGGGIVAT